MVRVDYVRKLYTTVTFHFSSSMWRFFWLSHNCVIYAFVTTTQLTLFFGTFRLRVKVTLYLRFFLVSHCDILCIMWQLHFSRLLKHIFLITLEMRCLLTTYGNTIQLFCVLGPHFWITFLWYVCINIEITLQLWLAFVCHCDILLRHNYVTYLLKEVHFDGVRITLNYRNCWNVWLVYGSYVINGQFLVGHYLFGLFA